MLDKNASTVPTASGRWLAVQLVDLWNVQIPVMFLLWHVFRTTDRVLLVSAVCGISSYTATSYILFSLSVCLSLIWVPFLVVSQNAKFTVTYVMSVCPFVCTVPLGCQLIDFHEIPYLSIFWIFINNFHVSSKSDKNNSYFKWRPMFIYDKFPLNSC